MLRSLGRLWLILASLQLKLDILKTSPSERETELRACLRLVLSSLVILRC